MKKFSLYYCLIFLVYFFVMTSANAALFTSDEPMIVDPDLFPELKQEANLIDYIVEYVHEYIDSHDWSTVLDMWVAQDRVDEIEAILTKYGYDHELHYIELKEVLHRTGELAWYELTVIIFYKENPKIQSVNIWKIIYGHPAKKEGV